MNGHRGLPAGGVVGDVEINGQIGPVGDREINGVTDKDRAGGNAGGRKATKRQSVFGGRLDGRALVTQSHAGGTDFQWQGAEAVGQNDADPRPADRDMRNLAQRLVFEMQR